MPRSADYTREQTRPALGGGAKASTVRAAPHAVAIELPAKRLSTAELAERFGLSEDWIVSRTGVRERPMARPDERLSDFASRAAAAALSRAGVDASEVDLVLVATITQDELTPNAAPLVAHSIGAYHAGAIDIGAACTGFLSAAAMATAQIETGRARWVLVVGADFITRIIDWDDKRSAPLFGDAAGAVLFGPAGTGPGAIGPMVLGADGSEAARAIVIDHHERKIRMNGPEVYRNAVARMAEATLEAVARAGRDARGHRPVRLPPGQRTHHACTRGAPRSRSGTGRRLHRIVRKLIRGHAAAGPGHGGERRAAGARYARPVGGVRRWLHLGGGVIEWGGNRDV